MVDAGTFLSADGESIKWGALGGTILAGVLMAFFRGAISGILGIGEYASRVYGGVSSFLASVILWIGSIPAATISVGGVEEFSLLAVLVGLVSVLAAFYVVSWGVSILVE